MTRPRTMLNKIGDAQAVVRRDDGEVLLCIDRHYVIEGSFHAFDRLRREGLPARRPGPFHAGWSSPPGGPERLHLRPEGVPQTPSMPPIRPIAPGQRHPGLSFPSETVA